MAPKRKATAAAQPAPAKPTRSRRRKPTPEKPSRPSKATKLASEAQPAKRRRVAREPQLLERVTHPSHGKVGGDLFVFGDGDCGQLGLGEDVVEKYRPFPISVDGKKVLQVACGGMHTVALVQGGDVFTWGVNDEGALGRKTAGEPWDAAAKHGAGDHKGHATDSYTPARVAMPAGVEVVQVSAGDSHTCCLTALGGLVMWGTFRDASGVMGFAPGRRLALLPATVYEPREAEEQVVQIASGADHVLALTRNGKVLSCGNGQQGQLGRVGPRMSDRAKMDTLLELHPMLFKRGRVATHIVEVNCGTYHSFMRASDGRLFTCGLNNYGQLGLADTEPLWAPTLVKGLPPVSHACGGQHHSLAIAQEGVLLSFGRPTYGRLGRKDVDVSADSAAPEAKPVDGLEGVVVAGCAAGLAVSGCFAVEGGVWTWGFGTSHQLGKGDDDEDEVVPRKLPSTKLFKDRRVMSLEFGGQHAALLAAPVGEEEEEAGAGVHEKGGEKGKEKKGVTDKDGGGEAAASDAVSDEGHDGGEAPQGEGGAEEEGKAGEEGEGQEQEEGEGSGAA